MNNIGNMLSGFYDKNILSYIRILQENPIKLVSLTLDIAIVIFLAYELLRIVKDSRAWQLVKGIALLVVATALSENGRSALDMANSASDAGASELDIRTKMIKEGIIKQMVTLPSNMFTSVTLPATLWFFDKQKITIKDVIKSVIDELKSNSC